MTDKMPVVKVLIRNQNNEFLVVSERESSKWELAGGIIEKNENRFEAAKREVNEELDLEISGLEDVVRLELEDDRIIDCYIIYAEKYSGNIETGGDISEVKWVAEDDLTSINWHIDSSYNVVPMKYLEDYLEKDKNY
jgi:8-oxo-dGTP pyrophosphatase MutT (NUDIX family)